MVAYIYYPSTLEVETETSGVQGQPELQETLPQKYKSNFKKIRRIYTYL